MLLMNLELIFSVVDSTIFVNSELISFNSFILAFA